jgi:hypothetical protein
MNIDIYFTAGSVVNLEEVRFRQLLRVIGIAPSYSIS